MSQQVNPKLLAAIRQFLQAPVAQQVTGSPGVMGDYSKVLNSGLANPTITTDDFQKRYGVAWEDLSPEIQAKMNSLYNISASMGKGNDSGFLQGLLQKGKSALVETGDFLLRGEAALAEGIKDFADSAASGDNPLHAVGSGIQGAWQGISGQEKTTWSDVIQHIADVGAARDAGQADPIHYALNQGEGQGHVPGWVRWGVGLPADIVLDPLNLVGVGEVAKVVQTPKMLKDVARLSKAAEEGAQLGAHARLDEALKSISAEERAKVESDIRTAMEAEGKHFQIGHGDTPGPGGLVTKLMATGKYKTGAHAKTAAEGIVAKNTADLQSRVQTRLEELARTKAFENATPQELELELKAALGVLDNITTDGWETPSRLSRHGGPSLQTRAESLKKAIDTIKTIQHVRLQRDVEALLPAEKAVLSEENIAKQVADFKNNHYDEVAKLVDSKAKTASVNMKGLGDHPHGQILKDAVEKEFADFPELAQNVKQVIAVDKMIHRGEEWHDAAGLANADYKTVRLHTPTMGKEAEGLVKYEQEYFAKHGYKAHSVLADNPADLVKGIAYHELGHQWHYLAGMGDRAQFASLLRAFAAKFPDVAGSDRKLAHAISHYAVKDSEGNFNAAEFVAEAFAAERMGQGNEYTKFIVDFVTDKARKRHSYLRENSILDKMKELTPAKYEETLRAKNAETLAQNLKNKTLDPKTAAKLVKQNEEETLRLVKSAHRVLDPAVQRRIAIKLNGTSRVISIPGSGRILRTAKGFNESENFFNNTFRATAGVPPELQAEARKYASAAQVRIEEQTNLLRAVWGKISLKDRERVIDSWINGGGPIKGAEGENLVENFRQSIREIQKDLEEWLDPRILVKELDHQLPHELKLFRNGQKRRVWTDRTRTALKENWLEDALRNIVRDAKLQTRQTGHTSRFFRDPTSVLMSVRGATERAKNFRIMRSDMVTELGHRGIRGADGKLDPATRTLMEKFGYKQAKIKLYRDGKELTPFDMKDVYFPPEVADGIQKIYRVLNNDTHINDAVHMYDRVLRIWKTAITRFNPGYHERNLFGEVSSSWFGGVWHIKYYTKALNILWKHDKRFLDPNRVEKMSRKAMRATNALMSDPAKAARLMAESGKVPLGKPILVFHGRPIYHDEMWHLFTQEAGLHTGFISSDFANPFGSGRFGAVGHAVNRVGEGAQYFTEQVEDFARLAHFIKALSRNAGSKSIKTAEGKTITLGERDLKLAVREAAMEVRKYHHDFSDFTHFETNVMARLVPFYKWTRKNMPLMAELLITQPGKADKFFSIPQGISTAAGFQSPDGSFVPVGDAIVPGWLKDHGAVPLGHLGGNTQYLDLPLPMLDALKMASDPVSSTGFMITPPIKALLETATGHQIGGAPINDKWKYVAQQSPYSNLAYKQGQDEGKLSSALQFLFGIGLQPNTDRRMLSEAIRAVNTVSQQRKEMQAQ